LSQPRSGNDSNCSFVHVDYAGAICCTAFFRRARPQSNRKGTSTQFAATYRLRGARYASSTSPCARPNTPF